MLLHLVNLVIQNGPPTAVVSLNRLELVNRKLIIKF